MGVLESPCRTVRIGGGGNIQTLNPIEVLQEALDQLVAMALPWQGARISRMSTARGIGFRAILGWFLGLGVESPQPEPQVPMGTLLLHVLFSQGLRA